MIETEYDKYIKLQAAIKKAITELYEYQDKAIENRDEMMIGECICILKKNTEGLI